jgi:hypothetical protein
VHDEQGLLLGGLRRRERAIEGERLDIARGFCTDREDADRGGSRRRGTAADPAKRAPGRRAAPRPSRPRPGSPRRDRRRD